MQILCSVEWNDGPPTQERLVRGKVLSFVYGSRLDDIFAVIADRDGKLHAKSIYNLRVLSDLEIVRGARTDRETVTDADPPVVP